MGMKENAILWIWATIIASMVLVCIIVLGLEVLTK